MLITSTNGFTLTKVFVTLQKRIINFLQKGFLKGFNIFENIQTCDFQVHLKLSILNLLRTSVRLNLH